MNFFEVMTVVPSNISRILSSRSRAVALKTLDTTKQNVAITRRFKRTSTKNGIVNKAVNQQKVESNEAIFGLRPVDYTVVVPKIFHSPPPPPPKPGFQKYLFPTSILATLGITAYFYFNNENDSKDYWETMQTGGALPGTYDDDDDDFEYEDEDEE